MKFRNFLAIGLLISLFIPSGLALYIGSIKLEVYKVILLVALIPCSISLVKEKLTVVDGLIFLSSILIFASFVVKQGFAGLETSIVKFLEIFVAFKVGSDYVASYGTSGIKKLIKYFGMMALLLLPFAVYESLSGVRIWHVIVNAIGGEYSEHYVDPKYYRNGVYRTGSVFNQPILFSIAMAVLFYFSLYTFTGSRTYNRAFPVLGSIVASMSTIGFLMIVVQLVVKKYFEVYTKWRTIKIIAVVLLVSFILVVEIGSDDSFVKWLALHSSFNSWNAYVRLLQWEFAWIDVLNNPIWGTLHGDWSRPFWLPGSIDSYWLALALSNGLIATVSLLVTWLLVAYRSFKLAEDSNDSVCVGIFAVIISIVIAGFTVHFFDRLPALLYLLLGVFSAYIYRVNKVSD